MPAFLLRRLLEGLFAMLVVAMVAFALFRFLGDPVVAMAGNQATEQDREELRQSLGLNDPVPMQFLRFVGNAARGEFGISYRSARPVASLIAERLPATLELVLVASVLSLVIGIALGVYTALYRDSAATRVILTSSLIGISLPTFVTGTLLIWLFSIHLNWLPSFGRGETVAIGWWTTGLLTTSGQKSVIMPAITLALFQLTLIQRLARAEMLEVLRTDFVRFARARGLSYRAVYFGHALKNALLPVITIAGLNIGAIIGFSVITETIFQWPGMSLLFIEAVRFGDIPVLAAYLVLVALIFTLINMAIDVLYMLIDPRLRVDRGALAAHGS